MFSFKDNNDFYPFEIILNKNHKDICNCIGNKAAHLVNNYDINISNSTSFLNKLDNTGSKLIKSLKNSPYKKKLNSIISKNIQDSKIYDNIYNNNNDKRDKSKSSKESKSSNNLDNSNSSGYSVKTEDSNDPFYIENLNINIDQNELNELIKPIPFPLNSLKFFSNYFEGDKLFILTKLSQNPTEFFTSDDHYIEDLLTLPFSYVPLLLPQFNNLKINNNESNYIAKKNNTSVLHNYNNKSIVSKLKSNFNNSYISSYKDKEDYENPLLNVLIVAPSYLKQEEFEEINTQQSVTNMLYSTSYEGLTYEIDQSLTYKTDLNSLYVINQRIFFDKIKNAKLANPKLQKSKNICQEDLEIPIFGLREPKLFLKRLLDYFIYWNFTIESLILDLNDEAVFLRRLNLLISSGFHRVLASQGLPFNLLIGETAQIQKDNLVVFAECKSVEPVEIVYNLRYKDNVIKLDGCLSFLYEFDEVCDEFIIKLSNANTLKVLDIAKEEIDLNLSFVEEKQNDTINQDNKDNCNKQLKYKTFTFNFPLKYSVKGITNQIENEGNVRCLTIDSFVLIVGVSLSSICIYNSVKNNCNFWSIFSIISKEFVNCKGFLDNNHSIACVIFNSKALDIDAIGGAEDHLKFYTKVKDKENYYTESSNSDSSSLSKKSIKLTNNKKTKNINQDNIYLDKQYNNTNVSNNNSDENFKYVYRSNDNNSVNDYTIDFNDSNNNILNNNNFKSNIKNNKYNYNNYYNDSSFNNACKNIGVETIHNLYTKNETSFGNNIFTDKKIDTDNYNTEKSSKKDNRSIKKIEYSSYVTDRSETLEDNIVVDKESATINKNVKSTSKYNSNFNNNNRNDYQSTNKSIEKKNNNSNNIINSLDKNQKQENKSTSKQDNMNNKTTELNNNNNNNYNNNYKNKLILKKEYKKPTIKNSKNIKKLKSINIINSSSSSSKSFQKSKLKYNDIRINQYKYKHFNVFNRKFKKLVNLLNYIFDINEFNSIITISLINKVIIGSWADLLFYEVDIDKNCNTYPVYLNDNLNKQSNVLLNNNNNNNNNNKYSSYSFNVYDNNFLNKEFGFDIYNENGYYLNKRNLPITDGIYREDFLWYYRGIKAYLMESNNEVEKTIVSEFIKKSFINAKYYNQLLETISYRLNNISK